MRLLHDRPRRLLRFVVLRRGGSNDVARELVDHVTQVLLFLTQIEADHALASACGLYAARLVHCRPAGSLADITGTQEQHRTRGVIEYEARRVADRSWPSGSVSTAACEQHYQTGSD